MQHMAATDGETIDRRDDRLGHVADDPVQRFDLEQATLGRAVVTGFFALLLIATGTEGLLPAPVRQSTPTSSLLHAHLKHLFSSSTVLARNELSCTDPDG